MRFIETGDRVTHIGDGSERIDDIFLLDGCVDGWPVTFDLFGDIVEQFGEISNLEQLVGGKQLKGSDAVGLDRRRKRPIGEGALRFLLNHGELRGAWVGEAIWQGKLERCCSNFGDSGRDGNC